MESFVQDPTFWVAVAFVIAIAAVARPLGRMILGGLDRRSGRIAGELDEARRLREEARQLLDSCRGKLDRAGTEAEAILDHARREAALLRERSEAALDRQLARRRRMALDRIAQAESDAVDEVRAAAADLALRATRRLLDETLDADRQARLVDDAIEDIGRRLH